jgi:dienelactone hydrolase
MARQATTAESLVALLGGFPEKPPLDITVLEVAKFDAYSRTLIEYTTLSEERVQAFLLLPHVQHRTLPGILAIHQDGNTRPYRYGKSEPAGVGGDPELGYGLELCLRGYAVICPDRFPYESRSLVNSPYREIFADFRIWSSRTELTEDLYRGCVANRLLVEGWTQMGKELFELQRALDCLVAQPEVDGDRLGAVGHSAGGLLTAWSMYVDQRVKVGCVSCGTWRVGDAFRDDYLRPMQGFGGLLAIPGLRQWGDVDDILAGLAPRPYFEAGDPGSPEEVAALTQKARVQYAALGSPENFVYTTYEADHTFRQDMRERSCA